MYHRKSLSFKTPLRYLCLWRRLDRTQTSRTTHTPRKEQSVIRRRSIFSPLQAAIATVPAINTSNTQQFLYYITSTAIHIQQEMLYTTVYSIHNSPFITNEDLRRVQQSERSRERQNLCSGYRKFWQALALLNSPPIYI